MRAGIQSISKGQPAAASALGLTYSQSMRYIVLPLRPAGTERLSEEELVNLVTRDSMIGVSVLSSPRR